MEVLMFRWYWILLEKIYRMHDADKNNKLIASVIRVIKTVHAKQIKKGKETQKERDFLRHLYFVAKWALSQEEFNGFIESAYRHFVTVFHSRGTWKYTTITKYLLRILNENKQNLPLKELEKLAGKEVDKYNKRVRKWREQSKNKTEKARKVLLRKFVENEEKLRYTKGSRK